MKLILFLKILSFVSKGSLNIPDYRYLLIGRVQYLYTLKHAVENIAYHSTGFCNSLQGRSGGFKFMLTYLPSDHQ